MSENTQEEAGPVKVIVTPVRCEYQFTPGIATQKFLRAFEKGKVMGQACDKCGKVYVPPRGACGKCGAPTSKEVECSNKGTVVTMTIVRVPSENIDVELPYVAANVLLDGADITFTALIQECNFEEVRVGMRVEGVWKPESEWEPAMTNLKYFRPIDEPDVPFEQIKEIS